MLHGSALLEVISWILLHIFSLSGISGIYSVPPILTSSILMLPAFIIVNLPNNIWIFSINSKSSWSLICSSRNCHACFKSFTAFISSIVYPDTVNCLCIWICYANAFKISAFPDIIHNIPFGKKYIFFLCHIVF